LRSGGNQEAALSFEAGGLALELGQTVDLDQVLVEQVADAGELAIDQLDLSRFGVALRGVA
jgi:hypothetical protein